MLEIPFYRLAEMMQNKYGQNYETRFQLVARILAFDVKEVINEDFIRLVCDSFIVIPQLKNSHVFALKRLFGFKKDEDFFTFPELMPEDFKIKQSV